jgi:homoserine O-succinyltransferase
MPVFLDAKAVGSGLGADAKCLRAKTSARYQEGSAAGLHIGLINNMGDPALEATERQFFRLLEAASDGVAVHLSFYALPDVPRNDWGRQRVNRFYSGIESLGRDQLDGLIVTGREPRTPNLKEEPYWGTLTGVLEWAENHTHSTVWSCLAAHAALLQMDGIARRKNTEKYCGVYECARLREHPLLAGTSSRLKMPHSRWNDIPEEELTAAGYSVLTRALGAGADTIVKNRNSLFVFFQGHPEYEPDTLLLEYRRDVRRYLSRETDAYPSLPQAYFDDDTAHALIALQEKAIAGDRSEELLAQIAAVLEANPVAHTWRSAATQIYSNWLKYIGAQKLRAVCPDRQAVPVQPAVVG